jgi:hypothetical protein
MRIRDLVYFDFDKATSIWSQIEGGLLEKVSVAKEETGTRDHGVSIGIPKIAEMKIGGLDSERKTILESKILHHDLLNRLEDQLAAFDLVADLTTSITEGDLTAGRIREAIGDKPYVRANGWSVIEDYRRMASVAAKFNQIVEFVSRSALETIKASPEYLDIQRLVAETREIAKQEMDRNKKATQTSQLRAFEAKVNEMSKPKLSKVESWILDGIQHWISTFMPNRINFRIYPFEICPSFQVLCNLKRECFVDQDLEHLLYGYGIRPNIILTVFGIITAIPAKSGETFDPMKEFEEADQTDPKITFEKAFRGVFGGMDAMESLVRYSRYPNITVHPIAVYRDIQIRSSNR